MDHLHLRIPASLQRDEMPDLLRHWYLGPPARRHMMLRRFHEVDRELDAAAGTRVLDIGSAWGYNVMSLNRMGLTATGVDLVADQFAAGQAIASENGIDFTALGADASALPFQDGVFDRITMVETFEHIYAEDRPRALAECFRVLRPGGRLVLSTPNYNSMVERFKRLTGNHPWLRKRLPTMCYPDEGVGRDAYHPYRYHRPMADDAIRALLEGAGFDVLKRKHFLFVLKNTPSPVFALLRAGEAFAERIPGIRRMAATVCFVAGRRGR